MREVTATLAAAALAIALAGCASAPPSDVAISDAELPTTAAEIDGATSSETAVAVPSAEASVEPGAASPMASIRRGPVRAVIEAVRQSDGASLGVRVDAPRAVDGDPLVTADCGEIGTGDGLTIVVQDLAVHEGVATATLGVAQEVHDGGSYDGVVTFLDASGEAIQGAGTVVVGDDLDSGTFDVADPESGDHLIGVWECRAL
ncbi:hypothetical protein [Demequina salsinemoris]|uniref:hypothetical protein n=1 Tax=Demequina salsinemoris TaxID=577470 RepID=UPI000780C1AB|nr:hypothetical protein [Demequina salsinemoris]